MIKSYKDMDEELYYFKHQKNLEDYIGRRIVFGKVVIILPDCGTATVLVNEKRYVLDSTQMLLMHPHSAISMMECSKDFSCNVVALAPAMQEIAFMQIEFSFFGMILRRPCWTLDGEMRRVADSFFSLFEHICMLEVSDAKADLISDLFLLFLRLFYEHTRPFMRHEETSTTVVGRSLVSRFFHLLRQHFRTKHQVIFYADKLCVTPKYLAQVVRNTVGVTPKDIIDRALAMEALNLLRHTSRSIQEISDELGFFDQSYFGRFFRRIFEMSPMQFRANPSLDILKQLDDLLDRKYPNLKEVWKDGSLRQE